MDTTVGALKVGAQLVMGKYGVDKDNPYPIVWLKGNPNCDLREALTFHNDKSADHGFFGEAPPPGCRPGQREVQAAEKLVVECSGAL